MFRDASGIEISWTLACSLGLVFAIYRLYAACGDELSQRRRHEGKRVRLLSMGNVLQELERCIVLSALTLAGIIAMFTPPARVGPPSRAGWAITVAFISVAITLAVGSIIGERIRKAVLSVDDEEHC